MTGISKFLLTGLGGVGVVTATGYGVYYDVNNKKIEKSKKNEDFKTKSQDENADASKLEEGKENELKEEESESQKDNQDSQLESEVKTEEVIEKSEESDISKVSSSALQSVGETNVQQQDTRNQGDDSQEQSDEKLSEQQPGVSDTESETGIQVSVSPSEEEVVSSKPSAENLSPLVDK